MKKLLLSCSLLFSMLIPLAEAKEILGLNFCGQVSVDVVKQTLEKNGAKFIEVKVIEDTDVTSIKTLDYQIAGTNAEVEFEIYKGKLFRIEFKDGNIISNILDSKYGRVRTSEESGLINKKIFHFNSKDKDIDIFETFAEVSPTLGLRGTRTWHHATYECKSINKILNQDYEKKQKQKQLQIKGANQL